MVLGGALAIGLAAGGALIGNGVVYARVGDRTVSVRGVSEREVKSDLAVLPVSVTAENNVAAEAQARVDRDLAGLRRFLTEQGYPAAEVQLGRYYVTDQHDGVEEKSRPPERWAVQQSLTVRTRDVDRVERTTRALNDLIRKGDLSVDYSEPSYYFTRLNDLRAPMIGEATASARTGAQEFANDSKSRVGGIKDASQGYFEIEGRDPGAGEESTQLFKRVRVVTTVAYRLR